ncbi:flagella assembly protein FlgT middle domain-containing protein [Chitinilyticum litopenaei]|uniref:flagella assembly protein FlgT middle domain-containing protein n=1 Tax=Chitinilyticum litopenaei TaxID=1121276 RepID=UPI0003FF0544|nr:flagella assembly protein FlgT middle domain-containing protein [Chitinilyticum litopenaei]
MIRLVLAACFASLLSALGLPAQAAEFTGVAPLGSGGVELARAEAIRDALHNASLAAGTRLRSSLDTRNSRLVEYSELSGAPVGDYTLLQEWQANGFWHVRLDVAPARPASNVQPGTAGECGFDRYRRKLLLTYFYVQQPSATDDLLRVPEGLQSWLGRELFNSGHYLPQQAAYQAAFHFSPKLLEPQQMPERVHELALRFGVQFVVGGIVRDTGFAGERYTVDWGNDVRPGERKQVLNVPGARFAQFGVKATPAERRFDVELFVFDGISGALLARQLFSGTAAGSVVLPEHTEFASSHFFRSDYGRMVRQVLGELQGRIDATLSCLPLSARVVRLDGRDVYIDAGAESGMRPGDTLRVYRRKNSALPVQPLGAPPGSGLGEAEELRGRLTLTAVQPLFAIGRVDGAVEPGDHVRIEKAGGTRQ